VSSLARVLLAAALCAWIAAAPAQTIFTEDFSSVTVSGFLNLGVDNTSERWSSTLYAEDPVDAGNQWQFFESSYLAYNDDTDDRAILLNEAVGSATAGLAMKTPGTSVVAGQTNTVTGDQAILLNEAAGSVNAGVAMKTPGIPVVAGQTYTVSFDHWGDNRPGVYSFQVEVDNLLLPIVTRAFAATGTGGFLTQTFSFIAPDNEIVLTFTDITLAGESSGIIDNIAVALIPEPGTYALLLAGLGFIGFVASRRRRPLRAGWQ